MSTKISPVNGPEFLGLTVENPTPTGGAVYTDDPALIEYAIAKTSPAAAPFRAHWTVTPNDPHPVSPPYQPEDGIVGTQQLATNVNGRLRDAAVAPLPQDHKPPSGGAAPGLSRIGEVA